MNSVVLAAALAAGASASSVRGGHSSAHRTLVLDKSGRRLIQTASIGTFARTTSFLAVQVGDSWNPYDTAQPGIALPVYVTEYSLATGAFLKSVPLPQNYSDGYRPCTLARGQGANGWNYDLDGMPTVSANEWLFMLPCFDVEVGKPITEASNKTIAILGANTIWDTSIGFSGPGGFRMVSSVTGTSAFYTVHQSFAKGGIHYLSSPSAGVTKQVCTDITPGCSGDVRAMAMFPYFPGTGQPAQLYQLHTADRGFAGVFKANPVNFSSLIANDANSNMAALANVLNDVPSVMSLTFGETNIKVYLALENVTYNGTFMRSAAVRYDYKQPSSTTPESYGINAWGQIADNATVSSSFSKEREVMK